jgi:uncharacterized repeat protein (TIGR01451 family)
VLSSNNLISGNFISGNGGDGILVNSSSNTIGGTAAGAANIIANNKLSGVNVQSGNGTSVLSNSIDSNGRQGIVLAAGANNNQSFPVIDSVTSSGGFTTVLGTLDSTKDFKFEVQFFRNDVPDPSSFGEGQTFLGEQTVVTDGFGHAQFAVRLPATVSPVQFLTATATDPAGNTSEFSQEIADLAIAATGPTPPPAVGQDFTLTLTLTNTGPFPAYNPTVTDTLPANVTFVSATGGATPQKGVLTIPVGTVPVGGTSTVSVVLRPTALGIITNSVAVSSIITDPDPSNNTATTSVDVTSAASADLAVTGVAQPDAVFGGDPLTYSLTVTNNGPDSISGVTLTDTLTMGTTLVSSSIPPASQSGPLVFDISTIGPGAQQVVTITIVVDPTATATLTNVATVTGPVGTTDPNPSNNTAQQTVGVLDFVVTTTADLVQGQPADGSLRAAILNSNRHPGMDTITFDIKPQAAVESIRLNATLPAIKDAVTIDATTQPGYHGKPIVLVDGSATGGDGLQFTVGGSTVKGLAIGGFPGAGISLLSGDSDLIQNCFIGTDASGASPDGNGIGVLVGDGKGITIGGTTTSAGNTISGNLRGGKVTATKIDKAGIFW